MKLKLCYVLLLAGACLPSQVAAASSADRAIERTAQQSYNFVTLLDSSVQISVEDGTANLSGSVRDRNLRALATDTVERIPGVRGVINRMVVDPAISEYSDTWIASKLRACFRARAGIDPAWIRVEVSHQEATLTGTVQTPEQKQLAEKYARATNWVRSVHNQLTLDSSLPGDTASRGMDDASISALLIYSLKDERLITVSRTRISTKNGVVLISGHAESEEEKLLISTCALSIRGVASVRNNMLVKDAVRTEPPYAAR